MADTDPNTSFDLPEESKKARAPWIGILAGLFLFGLATAWILRSKEENKSREAVVAVLEKELDMDQAALQTQKDKVLQLTQQLESAKAAIRAGQVKDGKKAVADYNQ